MRRPRFLISPEESLLVDTARHALPDAPPEATGPTVLLCPHCGNDERSERGPHEMFDVLSSEEAPPLAADRHFRCRDCGEVSPVWCLHRDGGVTSHLRDAETGEPRTPPGFHSAWREG